MRARNIGLVLGIPLIANGVWMLAGPYHWYLTVPGPAETGPFNPHFVRDIGAAYATAGAAALLAGLRPRIGVYLMGMPALFLLLHAFIHAGERLTGAHHGSDGWIADLPFIWLPALACLAAALWFHARFKEDLIHDDRADRTAIDPGRAPRRRAAGLPS
jgi:hypothetical protein